MADIYILQEPEMPWGDYGNILLTGMTSHLPRHEGWLQLERTGPFIPPLALGALGDVVVTDAFKAALERAGLSGCTFRPAIKRRIVHLPWEEWDRSAAEPPEYPESGEPEDYILGKPHSPALAAQLGDVWEMVLGEHARSREEPVAPGAVPFALRALYPEADGVSLARLSPFFPSRAIVRESWDGTDWFRVADTGYVHVSERAWHWLERAAEGWIAAAPAVVR